LVLFDSPEFEVHAVGRKAANLRQLAAVGLPVPPAFVIPPATVLASLTGADLQRAIDQIGGFPVAVRSSGVLEDLEGASFAGQYESFLFVKDIDELRRRIQDCRNSRRSERMVHYLQQHGYRPEDADVAVLIQKMVDADRAGVAFTINPMTGREEHATLELCSGVGERLVSGHVAPTRYVLDLRTAGAVEESVGADAVALSAGERRTLAGALLRIQAHFGSPQDVEWAIDRQGTLWILQSRPITRIAWRDDVEEYTNADFKDGGVSARVSTPMMLSLYQNAFDTSMQAYAVAIKLRRADEPPARWFASYYGRGYWNASVVKRLMTKVPGFDERKFDQDLGIQKQYPPEGPVVIPTTLRTILPAIPVALALAADYARQLETVQLYRREFPERRRAWLERVARFPATDDATFYADLERVVCRFHLETEGAYFTVIYANTNAQTDFKQLLAKVDRATKGETAVVALLGGLTDVRHMDVQRGIRQLLAAARASGIGSEAWRQALRAFLDEHGFHSDAELDITVPRWSEVPERVTQMIRGMLDGDVKSADPDATARDAQARFDRERGEVLARLGRRFLLRRSFVKQLARVRTFLSAREEMRHYSTQCYDIVRRYLLEAGRRLAAAGVLPSAQAIFMLEIDDVRAVARAPVPSAELRAVVAYRQQMYDGYRALTPPNELGRGVSAAAADAAAASADGRLLLTGLGCSPGVTEGKARIIRSLDEVSSLQQGEILVTRFTDPGWTPALGIVAGVVTEVGGLLSHAAVIGREYGIPAVLNVPRAMEVLRSDQRIRVDGTKGTVEVLGA
jgi:phosphohistidine swiveling domain-containing protein